MSGFSGMEREHYNIGCLGIFVGFLSFVPVIGIAFGVISIFWGVTKRSRTLTIMGLLGILFTIVCIGYVNYNFFHKSSGYFSEQRKQTAIDNLDYVVNGLELYEQKYGEYPASLQQFLAGLPEESEYKNKVYDPTFVEFDGSLYKFHYELVNKKSYILMSKGFDGRLYTNDDIFPHFIDGSGLLTKDNY